MYKFVTKSQLLPISKTSNVHHFYQFQGKQIKEKQLQQKKQLDDFLTKIQQEQLKQTNIKSQPLKIATFSNKQSIQPQVPKSYLIDIMSSKHSSKQNKPTSTKSFNDFYQKNKRWKQNLQTQILKKKQQKIQLQERELSQCRKPLSQKDSKIDNIPNQTKNSLSLHHAFESKGPISGWTQRFHEYINKRLPKYPEDEFKPTINKKSKMIAGKMVGKVQDRLIKFGEILKMRKHQMIIEQTGKIGKLPLSQSHHYNSTHTNNSDLFFKLYKEGQKTNRRAKQYSQRKQFSFKPLISKIPQNLEKKVQQKRQKSPLYTTKKFTKQQTHRLLELYTKQTGKAYTDVEFQNFMKRNQLLLEKKNKQIEQKVKQDLMKEEKEFQQCTFIPLLNPKSIRMFERTEYNKSSNDEIEYEYSHDQLPLEQSPQQLFAEHKQSNKKTTNMKPKIKYSYNHAYTEPMDEFEYQINTPSKHQVSHSSFTNSKSPAANKLNEVSQMDSLQFSGQKGNHTYHLSSNLFNKNTHQKSSNHFRDENEVINYELTFSNTKLAHELSEINNINEEQQQGLQEPQESQAQMTINENKPKPHNLSAKSDRQMNEYKDKKQILQNSWENQLQKVKNRLQTLMKNSTTSKPQPQPQPQSQWI